MNKPILRKTVIELMTVERALELLSKNINNRTIRPWKVDDYLLEMQSGRWDAQRRVIQITPEGHLGNGQHRLTALVKYDKPLFMAIEYDVPIQEAILGDVMTSKGYVDLRKQLHGARNAHRETALTRAIGHLVIGEFNMRLPFSDLDEIIAENDVAISAMGRRKRFRALIWGTLAFARPVRPAAVISFADGLETGVGLRPNSAVLAMRNLLSNKEDNSNSIAVARVVAHKCLSALYHHIREEPMSKVAESRDAVEWWRKQRLKKGLDGWAARFIAKV